MFALNWFLYIGWESIALITLSTLLSGIVDGVAACLFLCPLDHMSMSDCLGLTVLTVRECDHSVNWYLASYNCHQPCGHGTLYQLLSFCFGCSGYVVPTYQH